MTNDREAVATLVAAGMVDDQTILYVHDTQDPEFTCVTTCTVAEYLEHEYAGVVEVDESTAPPAPSGFRRLLESLRATTKRGQKGKVQV